ncbi:MAG: hypothetical protein MI744_16935, partial [Pseudomonadales bacterium]|nr:hypothetical protein [Pseudomonadales bacterium]
KGLGSHVGNLLYNFADSVIPYDNFVNGVKEGMKAYEKSGPAAVITAGPRGFLSEGFNDSKRTLASAGNLLGEVGKQLYEGGRGKYLSGGENANAANTQVQAQKPKGTINPFSFANKALDKNNIEKAISTAIPYVSKASAQAASAIDNVPKYLSYANNVKAKPQTTKAQGANAVAAQANNGTQQQTRNIAQNANATTTQTNSTQQQAAKPTYQQLLNQIEIDRANNRKILEQRQIEKREKEIASNPELKSVIDTIRDEGQATKRQADKTKNNLTLSRQVDRGQTIDASKYDPQTVQQAKNMGGTFTYANTPAAKAYARHREINFGEYPTTGDFSRNSDD